MRKLFILLSGLFLGNASCQKKNSIDFENQKQVQLESNIKVLNALKNAGDKLIVSREVFHWIYFGNENDLNNYLKEIESKGFVFVSSNKIEDKLPYQLQIKRIDKVDPKSVDEYVIYLWQEAIKFRGEYDGWETSVEKE